MQVGRKPRNREKVTKMTKVFKSEHILETGEVIEFFTTKIDTVVICTALGYDKRVMWHNGRKVSLKELHMSTEHLFPQYIKDIERNLELLVGAGT